jgi:hypothetical protein
MADEKKIVFGGGRRQGKTMRAAENTKAAIEEGKQIYLPKTPTIANNDPEGGEANQS